MVALLLSSDIVPQANCKNPKGFIARRVNKLIEKFSPDYYALKKSVQNRDYQGIKNIVVKYKRPIYVYFGFKVAELLIIFVALKDVDLKQSMKLMKIIMKSKDNDASKV